MSTVTPALEYVTGIWNAEDIAHLPGTRWLVASGMIGPEHPQGHLHLIDMDRMSAIEMFPVEVTIEASRAPFDDVEPPDPALFDAHGVALRAGDDGQHLLYVVNHGGREAIEVFAVDARGDRPAVSWIGAVLQAPTVWGNAVAVLEDGAIVVTNYLDLTDPTAFDKVYAGEVTGDLKVWTPDEGWSDVPGSACATPNGVEASPDGRWFFIGSWSAKRVIRVSRGREPVQRDEIEVGFLADNAKWSADGRVLVAGQVSEPKAVFDAVAEHPIVNLPVAVIKVDPETLEVETLVDGGYDEFGCAATGLEVEGALWISNARGDRVARVREDEI